MEAKIKISALRAQEFTFEKQYKLVQVKSHT